MNGFEEVAKEIAEKTKDIGKAIPEFLKENTDNSDHNIDTDLYEPVSCKDNVTFTEYQKVIMEEYGISEEGIVEYHSWEEIEEEYDFSDFNGEMSLTDGGEPKKGGSYRDVKKNSDGSTHEVHHMPADSTSDIDRNDGPAIKMTNEDHAETASYGSSRDAREYREKQRELIEQGKFMEALKMDIEDIIEKFGDKYNEEIKQMLDYVKELIDKGIIIDKDNILDELYEMIGESEGEE